MTPVTSTFDKKRSIYGLSLASAGGIVAYTTSQRAAEDAAGSINYASGTADDDEPEAQIHVLDEHTRADFNESIAKGEVVRIGKWMILQQWR